MQSGGAIGGSFSPSFNAYSSSDCSLAHIAARVVSDFRHELDEAQLEEIDDVYNTHNHENDDVIQFSPPWLEQESPILRNDGVNETAAEEDEEEVEFEFACVSGGAVTSPVAAEEVFYNGQIRPVYPVFDQTLLNDDVDINSEKSAAAEVAKSPPRRRHQQLRMLMREEERASCSSSEADDLENLPPGTYCVWAPEKDGSNKIRVKSGSTGSLSKRWSFRDLLSRSSSDGSKDSLVILSPKPKNEGGKNVAVVRKIRNGGEGGDKRRSFLPYKQDLVGLFSNVNGLNRNLHPF